MTTYQNPILPGFYPDPSICRVEDDYYLVHSTFEYFPGVPIFHSKDLVHWRQIGNILNRPSQLDLDDIPPSKGIFAPTIRHSEGIFYLITTNEGKKGNFIVTSRDPAGDWSEPYWLPDAPGIDPSLFFDEDGRAYYIGTRHAPEGRRFYGDWEIWLQEIDLQKMQLIGVKSSLWKGALADASWPEGPHLYKINGLYYLLIAEGGTGHQHSVTIARSEKILGPYEGNPGNPFLTHRHLGKNNPIVNVGHGDLVQTQRGEWWMVLLASRPFGGYYRNLGRETFLVSISWEDDWPLANYGKGVVELTGVAPDLPTTRWPAPALCENFEDQELAHHWLFLRTPREEFWSLRERPGYLRLKLRPQRISEIGNPSFVGRRIQAKSFSVRTALEFKPLQDGESAGLVLLQNHRFHFRVQFTLGKQSSMVQLIQCLEGTETELAVTPFSGDRLYLTVEAHEQAYTFFYGNRENERRVLAQEVDGRLLSTEMAGGFVGSCVGMFATSNGEPSENYADFDWFEYGSR